MRTPDHSRFICSHCRSVQRGKGGLGVHISKCRDDAHPVRSDVSKLENDHVEFPADDDTQTIYVPRDAYQATIVLTDDERRSGWTIKTDQTYFETDDVGAVSSDVDLDRLLEQFREECRAFVEQDEKMDPVDAYDRVEEKFDVIE